MSEEKKRKEAIKGLKRLRDDFSGYKPNEEMFDMAIAALSAEPCEDAISRQAAIEKIHWLGLDNDTTIKCDLAIRALSPVNTQEPKKGHWINVNEGKWNTIPAYKCSACGANADLRDWSGESPFCPWCGAKMESEDEE